MLIEIDNSWISDCHLKSSNLRFQLMVLKQVPSYELYFSSLILWSLFSQSDTNEERVARTASEVCVRLHLAEEKVCRSITELFRDDVIRALQQSLLRPGEACALLVGPSCGKYDIYAPWNITLPGIPKPPVTPPSPPKPGSPQSRILFLTDIHWDQVIRSNPSRSHYLKPNNRHKKTCCGTFFKK